ncbi:MAG: chitobiase/beta-hexosaminidase C-terminal domain-containing protein [Fibrobacteria bacterium]
MYASIKQILSALAFTMTLVFTAGSLQAQISPPAELILKGKVRDFVESNPARTPVHPHFYGTRPHQIGCSSQETGVNIAQLDIDTTDDLGDTSVFKGDNRGPKLVAPLDARVAQCFDPVARFSDWYNDRPAGDVNRSFLIDIKFTRNPANGVYEYFDDNFYPIDNGKTHLQLGTNPPYGHLLPAPYNGHNYGFTMEFHAHFTYFKGTNQKFTFRGDDDVWVFINGKRVIDLGGIHSGQDAEFILDTVAAATGLQDSLVYPLDFFFAERHTTTSRLRITTTLELEPMLSKPIVTPGGFFRDQIAVTATHPSTAAVIHYTTDGSTPTGESPVFPGPLTLTATATLKFIATRPGYRNSEVVAETYTLMQTVAAPQANPTGRIFIASLDVGLTVATPGAVIRYTVDGSEPTETSLIFTAALTFTATKTLKAKAFLANWVPSATLVEIYTLASTLPKPVATPAGRGFVEPITVGLTVPGNPDAVIRYTVDESEPNETSPIFTSPLAFAVTTTLKAKAFKTDWVPSEVMVEVYIDASTLPVPVADPAGTGFTGGQIVRLSVPGHGDAQIRYTTDGLDPTAASPLYSAALAFTANTVLKAKAFKPDWKPSPIMTETYRRLVAGMKGVYVDNDGDGRIDGAVIRLDIPAADLPASVRLVDPFTRAPLILPMSAIGKGASNDLLIVRFPDQPFAPGTAFPTEILGSFPDASGFGTAPFPISDSAGPVPVRAVSHNKTAPEDHASIDITFSEPLDLAAIQSGNLWPFDIIRKGATEGGNVVVTSVEPVGGQPNTYRWTFAVESPAWPVYIDSLVLAAKPVIRDASGNPDVAGGKRVRVEGSPVTVFNKIEIQVVNSIEPKQKGLEPPVPADVRAKPFAAIGVDRSGLEVCLSCPPGTERTFLDNSVSRPEWILKSKYAFQFSFSVYDHLGQFVNKTQGKMDAAMIAKLAQDKDGFHSIRFRWIPVAGNGEAVGTGAYILKGVLFNHENEEQLGTQGENQIVKKSQTAVFKTFGYLRPR